MRIPSTPRRTGARSKPIHFSYVGTERGQPYEAYLAGPVWWGHLHMLRPSKPCVYEITGGQLPCRFCGKGKAGVAVVKGWVPLYRRIDTTAVCVPVDEVQRDHLDALKLHTKVTVGRERGKGVGVWVRACMNQEPAFESSLPECKVAADITESLINMWALDEVRSFFVGGATSDNAVSQVVEAAPVPDRRSGAGAVDAAVQRMFDRAKSVERNGNGTHVE